MAKVEKIDKAAITPPPDYVLTLTEEEAKGLLAFSGSYPDAGALRTILNSVYYALCDVGVPASSRQGNQFITSSGILNKI